MQDINEVVEDMATVTSRLKDLDFADEDILIMEDPSYNDINIFVRELALRVAKATAVDKRLLIFVYYAGHGI